MRNTKLQHDARGRGAWQGMNWIRQEKRLAVYLRDGLACAWCGDSVENGAALTLDHVRAHSRGGSNHETNLVTACWRGRSDEFTPTLTEMGAVPRKRKFKSEVMCKCYTYR